MLRIKILIYWSRNWKLAILNKMLSFFTPFFKKNQFIQKLNKILF